MKYDCDVIRDLLPLYCEDIASKKSREIVEEHCGECSECNNKLNEMRGEEIAIEDNGNNLRSFKKAYKKSFDLLLVVFCYMAFVVFSLIHVHIQVNIKSESAYDFFGLYTVILLPVVSLFCSMALADQKLLIKYAFPLVCALVGGYYPGLVNVGNVYAEFNLYFSIIIFILAIIGLVIGIIREKYYYKNLRKRNDGMIVGAFMTVCGIFVLLGGQCKIFSGVPTIIIGAAIYKVSSIIKRRG